MEGTREEEPVYVISVAARLAGLPTWVLRILDQEGVVVPVRTDSNRRLYSEKDIALLSHVLHLMKVRGVNIPGVKVILEMERAAAAQADSIPVAPDAAVGSPEDVPPSQSALSVAPQPFAARASDANER